VNEVKLETEVSQVVREHQDNLEAQEPLARLVPLVPLVSVVSADRWDLLVNAVRVVLLDPPAHPERLV